MSDKRRNTSISPLVISLLFQIFSHIQQLPNKPPITILLLAINILVHIHPYPNFMGFNLSNIQQNCIHPRKVLDILIYDKEISWNRLFLSSIIHADDVHLYYNMLSLLWKGVNLEGSIGTIAFATFFLFSLVVSHSFMIVIAWFLMNIAGLDGHSSGMHSCAVGFSAVLFSMKYVWNQISPEMTNIMGIITVPSKYAAWCELVIISIISPNASFIGHLAGILAGMLYLFLTGGRAWTLGFESRRTSASNRYTYYSGTLDGKTASSSHNNINIGDEVELEYVEDLPVRNSPGLSDLNSNNSSRQRRDETTGLSVEELRKQRIKTLAEGNLRNRNK